MIYLRHKNGNGKIYGQETFIDPDSFLYKDCAIFDKTDVWRSRICSSVFQGETYLRKSAVFGSFIGSQKHRTEISMSSITRSRVEGGTILESTLIDCKIAEDAAIYHSKLTNCIITGAVVVEDGVELANLTLHSKMRIGRSGWTQPPRYLEVKSKDGEIVCGVTESGNGEAYIGCQRKKITEWLKKKDLFAKVAGWDADIKDLVVVTLREWAK